MSETQEKQRKKKPEGLTQIIRVKIIGCDDDPKTVKKWLNDLSVESQQIANDFMSHWISLHIKAGNHILLREWIERDREWAKKYGKEAKKREKEREKQEKEAAKAAGVKLEKQEEEVEIPPRERCPVDPFSKEMSQKLYALVNADHSHLGTKPVGMITQRLTKTLKSAPASKSRYKRWISILCGLGEYPQSINPIAIPYYGGANAHLSPPKTLKDHWRLSVGYYKSKMPTKPKEVVRLSYFTLKLRTGGRKLTKIRQALSEIAAGRWILNTSSIVKSGKNWYTHICYTIPGVVVPSESKKTAFVSVGRYNPTALRIDGRTLFHLRNGTAIERARRSITTQRFSKNESYKHASSARKNHGRKSIQWREKNQKSWIHRTTGFNNSWAVAVARRCQQADVGHVIVYQPVGDWRDTRYLTHAGKIGRNESTGWNWYHMQDCLKRKLEAAGIKVTVHRVGESKKKDE